MRCICISSSDFYNIRFEYINEFFRNAGFETYYLITDYIHFEKKHQKTEHEGAIHIHVPGYEKNVSIKRLYSHVVFSNGVYKELKRLKPDVIYCNFPPNSLVKACVNYKKRNKNVGLVFDCFDTWPESMTINSPLLKLPFKIWKGLREDNLDYADKLIVVSDLGKQYFQDLHPDLSISTLYPRLPIRPEITYCNDAADSIKFCYLGNFNYITDFDLLVELLSSISKKKKVVLHHIGGGKNMDSLIAELEKNGIEFISHGFLFDVSAKEAVFSQCNLGINLPKQEVKSSMALKSIEYMRSGLPFVNSGIGDNCEIVDKYSVGFNCTKETVMEVSDRILKMNEDDLEAMHKRVIDCYQELFGEPDYRSIFSDVPNVFERDDK